MRNIVQRINKFTKPALFLKMYMCSSHVLQLSIDDLSH